MFTLTPESPISPTCIVFGMWGGNWSINWKVILQPSHCVATLTTSPPAACLINPFFKTLSWNNIWQQPDAALAGRFVRFFRLAFNWSFLWRSTQRWFLLLLFFFLHYLNSKYNLFLPQISYQAAPFLLWSPSQLPECLSGLLISLGQLCSGSQGLQGGVWGLLCLRLRGGVRWALDDGAQRRLIQRLRETLWCLQRLKAQGSRSRPKVIPHYH